MVAIACADLVKNEWGNWINAATTTVYIYNLLSGTYTNSHRLSEGRVVEPIWTQDEHLRFATVRPGSITLWETGITPTQAPVEVETLPAPDDINCSGGFLFLPALSRLAFTIQKGSVLVWDARRSELLLNFVGDKPLYEMSFSPDGRFFACGTDVWETYLWKESTTGYILHQRVIPTIPSGVHGFQRPLLSPNGDSIFVFGCLINRLWSTTDPIVSFSAQAKPAALANFVIVFSPDETLSAIARLRESPVTVLDLNSGDPLMTIDTGMDIIGLKLTGSKIVVVGQGKIAAWNLPKGDHTLGSTASSNDSIQTVRFDYPHPHHALQVHSASVSPDLNFIAVSEHPMRAFTRLSIYDLPTGKQLASTGVHGYMPWFTPDGCEVWAEDGWGTAMGWATTKDCESNVTGLEILDSTGGPSGGLPWRSSRGYRVTGDRNWILSPAGNPFCGCLFIGGRKRETVCGVEGSLGCCMANQ